MRRIIRNREIVGDNWVHVADGEPVPDGVDAILPLARFLSERESLAGRAGRLGVELSTADALEVLAPYLPGLCLVAVRFPRFSDGRGYSQARLLRMRHRFAGELRATGDVLPDQIFYLHRCGFDAFEVRSDRRLETALSALGTFSVLYQGAQDDLPLYRLRPAARARAVG